MSAKDNDWKARLGMVYSTNPDFEYRTEQKQEPDTLPPEKQDLRVWRESKGRNGKPVTLVRGFIGSTEDLQSLGRMLKNKCGMGGSIKDGEIIIQGDCRDRVTQLLVQAGYKAKKV